MGDPENGFEGGLLNEDRFQNSATQVPAPKSRVQSDDTLQGPLGGGGGTVVVGGSVVVGVGSVVACRR